MDGYLLQVQNTSDVNQTFDLFNTSDQTTITENLIAYGWVVEFKTNTYFNATTGQFQPGIYGWAYGGTVDPAIGSLVPSLTIGTAKTPDELTNLLNTPGEPTAIVGKWTIEVTFKPPTKRDGESGVGISYIRIFVNLDEEWSKQYVDTSLFDYGSKYFKIDPSGAGATVFLTSGSSKVVESAFGQGVSNNKNIVVKGMTNFSYDQFVNSVVQRTYNVKEFQIFSTQTRQLYEPLLFDRKLATGRVYQKVLTPTKDPYQSNNMVYTPNKKGYKIDGFTALKYTLRPYATARILMKYTYVDIATPLLIKKVPLDTDTYSNQGGYNPAVLTPLNPTFTGNIDTGFNNFGCKFLGSRLAIQEGKLNDLVTAGTNPRWQDFLRARIDYIKSKMTTEGCDLEAELPMYSEIGSLYQPRDLFIPTNDFIQHQIDAEQDVKKLLEKPDFPIDLGHNT